MLLGNSGTIRYLRGREISELRLRPTLLPILATLMLIHAERLAGVAWLLAASDPPGGERGEQDAREHGQSGEQVAGQAAARARGARRAAGRSWSRARSFGGSPGGSWQPVQMGRADDRRARVLVSAGDDR